MRLRERDGRRAGTILKTFGAPEGLGHNRRLTRSPGDGVKNNDTSRRDFLRATGGAIGAAWLGIQWTDLAAAAEHAHEAATGKIDHEFKVLTPAQARDVEAIAAQIVPSGATPGAREAGVVYFIDHVQRGYLCAQRRRSSSPAWRRSSRISRRSHPGSGTVRRPGRASATRVPEDASRRRRSSAPCASSPSPACSPCPPTAATRTSSAGRWSVSSTSTSGRRPSAITTGTTRASSRTRRRAQS